MGVADPRWLSRAAAVNEQMAHIKRGGSNRMVRGHSASRPLVVIYKHC